mmetsp:Transcript_2060/g.4455  ORF Transcript_2060/g.4455 Transcript_2060/m.4455 type:complete len:200 (+) Transcript_2060:221-820(+)
MPPLVTVSTHHAQPDYAIRARVPRRARPAEASPHPSYIRRRRADLHSQQHGRPLHRMADDWHAPSFGASPPGGRDQPRLPLFLRTGSLCGHHGRPTHDVCIRGAAANMYMRSATPNPLPPSAPISPVLPVCGVAHGSHHTHTTSSRRAKLHITCGPGRGCRRGSDRGLALERPLAWYSRDELPLNSIWRPRRPPPCGPI